jgi:hypothetical protein
MNRVAGIIVSTFRSRRFFYAVLLFFSLESAWIALSAAYPMAFDEDFHLGVIRIYAHGWSPFLSGQPDNAGQFGALAADPSYLYHYLMSFPYRLVGLVTDNQTAAIIVLRLFNIAMAVGGVWLSRRVLLRAGMSAAFTHTALALFVLIPTVPMLAGQINYDNAVLLLLPLLCLSVFDVYTSCTRRRIDLRALVLCICVCMLASLVKYAFLPFAAGAGLFVVVVGVRAFHGQYNRILPAVAQSWRALAMWTKAVLVAATLLSILLFVQRFGVNVVRYHTPVPSCDTVLSIHDCLAYGPWVRNYGLSHAKGDASANPIAYTWLWVQALHYRMFFAVNGPSDSYRNYPPLPLPSSAFVVLAVTGGIAVLCYGWRALRHRPLALFLLGMSVLYIGVLWSEDYSQFVKTGQPVAINGRYVLPVLLPLAAVYGAALREAFLGNARAKALSAAVVLLLFLHGGGVFTFIARSDPLWYWPNDTVHAVNENAQKLLLPAIYEGSKYYW